ncbi:MAG: cytidylate kinase family protein [Pseudomonadota bacterium]|uniref:Cytidylate kinase family protein n=1 Tax=Candidatus Desulfatibia profunda TaxID=2841695 RepID=A0A8J6NTS5_9BACT|nr:cytidylate kinase family protein [Candidatus Desulfatibia profunda]MBL7179124.1 cytidylate kinase family protein [Desulfobacterales bacterium]MBU0699465.1 cytidylate kinase family protein [Pseudomonadota bacterium]
MALITISYSMGTDGLVIARRAADKLGLELYDDQKLQDMVLELGIRSEEVKGLGEKEPGFFDRLLNRKPDIYLSFMDSIVYSVAQKGHGVIVGHGSQTLLQDFGCAMHVLIHNKIETRIKNLVETHKIDHEAAQKMILKSDNTLKGFFRFAYQRDWNDPSLYDLVLNTEKMGSEPAAGIIIEAARSEEMKACSLTAIDAMKRLSLAKKIEAELMKNDLFVYNLNIDVLEDGVVNITGTALTTERKNRVLRVVKAVPGVSQVKMSLFVRSASW